MCGLLYLQACWGMLVKFWEGDPPCIGLVGGGCPWGRIPQDQWLGDTCRFGCWASFSTCICSWANVLCLCCWAWDPVRVKGGPSPLGPGFICWKGNGWGPLGWRAELFSTTREPEGRIFTERLQLPVLIFRIILVTVSSYRFNILMDATCNVATISVKLVSFRAWVQCVLHVMFGSWLCSDIIIIIIIIPTWTQVEIFYPHLQGESLLPYNRYKTVKVVTKTFPLKHEASQHIFFEILVKYHMADEHARRRALTTNTANRKTASEQREKPEYFHKHPMLVYRTVACINADELIFNCNLT